MRAVSAAVLAFSVAVAAQQTPTPPATTFRSATDVVEVDVVVRDKNGAFVRDLSPDDFAIEEGGDRQEIQQFYVRTTDSTGRTLTTGSVAPAAPGSRPQTGRVFIVVFDDMHLSIGGFKRTQAAAETLFAKQFRPGDIGGVLVHGRIANDRLTSDREELITAVRKAKPNLSSSSRLVDESSWPRLTQIEAVRIVVNADSAVMEQAVQRACADDPDLCRRIPGGPALSVREKAERLSNESRAESARTLQTLAAALSGLARFEGRKAAQRGRERLQRARRFGAALVGEPLSLLAY